MALRKYQKFFRIIQRGRHETAAGQLFGDTKCLLKLGPTSMLRMDRLQSTSSRPPTSSQVADDSDNEANQREEEESQVREMKIRRFKKIFSTLLFGTTFGLAFYGRKNRNRMLHENLSDCTRLPNNSHFSGSHREFFNCTANAEEGESGTPCVFPGVMVRDGTIKLVAKFPVRSDDVFVASFPKSGTTWAQEIVYLIKHDLDFKKASEEVLENRFPYLEYPYPGIKAVTKQEGPRLIKTHLPYSHLPRDISRAKVIYIVRNPKDVVVSFYHFSKMLTFANFEGTFEEFVDQFQKDKLPYTPYFGHIQSYMIHEDDPNLLILSYEDLSKNPAESIRKIAMFLDKPLTEEEINLLVDHTSFDRMKDNPAVNYEHWNALGLSNPNETKFLRKGKVGDWKNFFTEHKNEKFDEWLRHNNHTSMKFVFDLNT